MISMSDRSLDVGKSLVDVHPAADGATLPVQFQPFINLLRIDVAETSELQFEKKFKQIAEFLLNNIVLMLGKERYKQ